MISLRDGAAIWWVAVALVLDQITKAIVVNTMMEPVIDQYYRESEWGF